MTVTPLIPYNRLLTALTNRVGSFNWAPFNAPVRGFSPSTNKLCATLRRELGLDVRNNDYAVVLAIGHLQSYHFMLSLLQDEVRTYDLQDHRKQPFSTFGGELTASALTGPPSIRRFHQEWPARTDISLTYLNADYASLSYGGAVKDVGFMTVADGRLQPDWSEDSGIRGLVKLPQGVVWGSGVSVRWEHLPVGPEKGLMRRLTESSAAQAVLFKSGAYELFGQMQTESERYACVCLALALLNDKVYAPA